MRLRKTLLLSFEGDGRLISELKSIVRMGHCGEFQVEEETLPTAAGRDLGPILQEVLTRISPTVIVLGIPQNFNDHAEPVFRILRRQGQEIPVFVVLESTRPEDVFAMLELGATDFAVAPLRAYDLLPRLRRLRPVVNESNSKVSQLKERLGLKQFIGESPALTEAIKLIPKLARCDASVFITGETGTGKEMFARALHYLSPRSGRPFIPVNCGAIPAELVENELFGHERGAFTGATSSARGLIHDADGGTLFLDEIDSLPLPTQVKLLRFLQDRTYRPLGSRSICEADVRIVAASNTEIEEAIRAGKFRSDLFYRINVLILQLPPLRERRDDIPLLARHFIAKFARESAGPAPGLSQAALQKLACYDWPGNVRELENVIQRAVVLCEQSTLHGADIVLPSPMDSAETSSFKVLKARVVLHFEKAYLQRLLTDHQGNISRAAKAASKDRRAFWQLLRKHQLHLSPPAAHREARPDNLLLR
jgi:DNA-binding NtrC family response regulator